ncbi:MAG TPA: hypothetical protein VGB78_03725 [Thermoplasmata archaeon]
MAALKDNIFRILETKQFSIEERGGYIYCSRDDVSVVIMIATESSPGEVEDFVKEVSGFPGRKVVASVGRVDEKTLSLLQKNSIHFWGREEIEHELGSMQLDTPSQTRRSLVDEVVQDELPQRLVEPHELSIPVIVESSVEKAERIVKPNFLLEEVKYLARHEVEGYKYDLELVPHYLFHFVITLGSGDQKAGIIAVNTLTRHAETWRWGFELVDGIDVPYSKREPKIDYEDARKIAQSVVDNEYKTHTEIVKDYGHAEIIESKRPGKDQVLIESKGLVYLPIWCVEGTRGAMIINSSTGKIISEHVHAGAEASETKLG